VEGLEGYNITALFIGKKTRILYARIHNSYMIYSSKTKNSKEQIW